MQNGDRHSLGKAQQAPHRATELRVELTAMATWSSRYCQLSQLPLPVVYSIDNQELLRMNAVV
jgi:hypothetical protein